VTRRPLAIAIGVAVVLAAAAAVLLVGRGGEDADDSTLRPVRARTSVSERIVAFGDTITARVDVAVDTRQVDPDAVRVRATFEAWRRVGRAVLERQDAGSSSHLRVTYVLRCAKQACVPERDTLPFDFDPARVEFTNRAGGKGLIRANWPLVTLHSRLGATDLANASPWRVDVSSPAEPSYRASPGLLVALLGVGALLLLAASGALAYAGWPRRVVEAEPEPEPEPEVRLSPLEQALSLLEDAASANGAADQRRSLELVAEVLGERAEDETLAASARALAWSPTPPLPEDTRRLAARVREALEDELRRLEEERLREEEERRRRLEEAHARVD
jgi:hypothetical protein